MPLTRFSDLIEDLQRLERESGGNRGELILEAFTRHTHYGIGAVYLRDGRDATLRLAAKSKQCVTPDILDDEVPSDVSASCSMRIDPRPELVVPLRSQRDIHGVVTLSSRSDGADDDLPVVRMAAAFLGAIMNNHRLMLETREGDFQLKYRLWELESLYDIGLSIASTLNIDELADEILFRMISLINARRAALFLREGTRFRLYRSFGDVRSEFLDEELTTDLLREGAPLSFAAGNDCIFPACSAYVAVPIKGSDGIIGVLAAADREQREGGIGAFEANEMRLLSLFASQAAIALENARLHREALEKQSMERELELAATIQRDILPKGIPTVAGMDMAVFARPARQLGGDYHVFFESEGALTCLVADVAGKSIPAALLVSALHAAVHLLFAEGRELGEIATELNAHIHRWSAENKFITMVLVTIDRESETLRYVNAGHNPAYMICGERIEQIASHGLPIGIMSGSRYRTQARPFPPGSAVVLYSDGITEAENGEGEEFENERLERVLREHGGSSAAAIRDAIAAAVDDFVGAAPQKDDQTIVIACSAT